MTLPLPDQNVIPRRLPDTREQLEELRKALEAVQRNLDEIAMQFPVQPGNLADASRASLAALGIACGVDSMTGNGSEHGNKVVAHGLDGTPRFVAINSQNSTLSEAVSSIGPSTFTANLRHIHGTGWSSTQPFNWVAIL